MFNRDLTKMQYGFKWARLFAALPDSEVGRVFKHALETKDESKLNTVLNRTHVSSAADLAAIHAAGFGESFLLQALPLAPSEVVPEDLVNTFTTCKYARLLGRLVNHIQPTKAQVISMLAQGETSLLDIWVKTHRLEKLWTKIILGNDIEAARTLYTRQHLPISNVAIANAGNGGNWDMAKFLLERATETDERILIMLVHFGKKELLPIAWRKAGTQCKVHTVTWLWEEKNHNHRSALLYVPLRDVPPQPDIIREATSLNAENHLAYFKASGWFETKHFKKDSKKGKSR